MNEPLEYTHWGQTWQVNDRVIEMRAEVGLLTRNVKVIGDTSGDSGARGWYAQIGLFLLFISQHYFTPNVLISGKSTRLIMAHA